MKIDPRGQALRTFLRLFDLSIAINERATVLSRAVAAAVEAEPRGV